MRNLAGEWKMISHWRLKSRPERRLMLLLIFGMICLGTGGISASRADEADAKRLFKAMSDYLGAQKAMSFDYDVNLELVSTQQQKIALASSGTLTLDRPDKLHVT